MFRGRFGIIIVAVIGLFLYWQANQTVNPFSGKKEFNVISIEEASRLGAQSYVQILQQEQGGVLCETTACGAEARRVVDTVREIGDRLRVAAIELEDELLAQGLQFQPVAREFDWTFNVVPSQQPNAFCLPGGYVAVYTQIMDVTGDNDGQFEPDDDLRDLDKLAVVMGHEIGHALAHHGAKRMSQGRIAQIGQMAVGVAVGDMDPTQRQAVLGAFGFAASGGLNKFSRDHETEADKIGLELLVRACFDPREAPELWERMGALGGGQRPPEWMSTHPASETRAENFRTWMPAAVAEYERRCSGGGF
ncbi:MAG: M48 family metallopeptidase [Pseudomonadota bacterium]